MTGRVAAVVLIAIAGAAAGPGLASAQQGPAAPVVARGLAPRGTGLSAIRAVSADGRYVLGTIGARYVVRDVVAARTVRSLPSSNKYRYTDLAGTGKRVLYARKAMFNGCPTYLPMVRTVGSNSARSLASTSRGRALTASWTAESCGDQDDEFRVTQMPNFSAPAISSNGRWAAFCANLDAPDRIDLYIKDLRTAALRQVPGVCGVSYGDTSSEIQAPSIAGDGQTVLLPGDNNADEESWGPFSLLVAGSVRRGIEGRDPVMPGAGGMIYASRPVVGCVADEDTCPVEPIAYDIATGATTALPPGTPVAGSMSASGQFVVTSEPEDAGLMLRVFDRGAGVATDLTANFTAAGLALDDLNEETFEGSEPIISGDASKVFALATDNQVYVVDRG